MSEYIIKDELDDLFGDLENNPEFQDAQAELEPGYQIERHRLKKGLTQAELAKLAGSSQSSIARLENGSSPPSLSFLRRVAKAMGAIVEVTIISDEMSNVKENENTLLDTMKYLHQSVFIDIKEDNYFKAHEKLNNLRNLIEKCQPSQELELLSEIINGEIDLLDQISLKSNSSSIKEFTLEAGLKQFRDNFDQFLNYIYTDQNINYKDQEIENIPGSFSKPMNKIDLEDSFVVLQKPFKN